MQSKVIFTVVSSHQLWLVHYRDVAKACVLQHMYITIYKKKKEKCTCLHGEGLLLTGASQFQVGIGAYQRVTLAAHLPGWEGRPAEAS
jgi:hypothetical protein